VEEGEGEGERGSKKCSRHSTLSLCQRVLFTLHYITSVQTLHCGWIITEAFLMDLRPVGSLDTRQLSPIFPLFFCIRLSPVFQASFFHHFLLECPHTLCK
jgi:hypothetical protein